MSRQIAGTGASGGCTQETARLYVYDGYDPPVFMDALMARFRGIAAVYRKMKSQQKSAVFLPEKHVHIFSTIKAYSIWVFVIIRGSFTI